MTVTHPSSRGGFRGLVTRWGSIVVGEFVLLVGYFLVTPSQPGALRYLLYPFVWINATLFAFWHIETHARTPTHWALAGGLSVGYFLLLMAIPGNIGVGTPGIEPSVRIGWYAPGWGPLVAATSPWIRLYLVPFEVIGYLGLAFLVYANLLEMTRATVSGVFGLATCVGCTVPILAPLVGILGGSTSSLITTAYEWSFDIGTVVFLVSVLLLLYSHPSATLGRG